MKNMKKFVSLALVIVSLLAVAAPALASDTGYEPYLGGDGSSHYFRRGHTGTRVVNLQLMLIKAGYLASGEDDGAFGSKTEDAVEALQTAHGLKVDGIVGGASKRALWSDIGKTAPAGCVILY
ncbi:MAG: peptidoglycan-binding domain-containing protein [Clostridia bacterium]